MPKPVPMPSSVKVGPHVYTILRKPASLMPNDLGHCSTNDLQICVRARLRKSKAREILLHECLHACTHPTVVMGGKLDDEEFVLAVSPVLLQVLQENPSLIDYLVDR